MSSLPVSRPKKVPAVQTDSGTFTLAITDAETQQVIPNASLITIPLNSSVAFPIGTTIDLFSQTDDPVSVIPASGVTIQGNQGLTGQYAMAHIRKIAADIWAMWGDVQQQAVYLLDKFTTPEAAPLASPRTCEPLGTLSGTDTGNRLSIVAGEMICRGTGASGVPAPTLPAVTKSIGLAAYRKIKTSESGLAASFRFSSSNGLWMPGTTNIVDNGAFLVLGDAAQNTDTYYEQLLVVRDNGAYAFARGGTQYPGWTLIWIFQVSYTQINFSQGINRTWEMSDLAMMQLYGDFLADYGIATSHLPTPTAGDTATMTADGFINFTWTPASAETLELDIRRTDDDNRWVIRCDQAGSTIKLIERNAGIETERASASQAWTAGTPAIIQARAVGNDIRTFVNSVAKNIYTGAIFNNTATGVKVAGFTTGANLAAFPRTLTGAPADEIERQLTWLGL